MSSPHTPEATVSLRLSSGRRRARSLAALTLASVAAITVAAAAAAAASKSRSPFEHVGHTEHPQIVECSGVAASLKQPGVLWVHNDSGNEPVIYAITAEGKTRGVFRVQNVAPENLQPVVMIECPRLMFPFAREIVAATVRNGGFPPLLLDPIDFVNLYRQRLAAAQTPAPGNPINPN